jgi:hypothetical protein
MKTYDFNKKAIDVRECTDSQKKWINKLIAKTCGIDALAADDAENAAFMYGDSNRYVQWLIYGSDYNKLNGYDEVHYTDFLKAVMPKGKCVVDLRKADLPLKEEVLARMAVLTGDNVRPMGINDMDYAVMNYVPGVYGYPITDKPGSSTNVSDEDFESAITPKQFMLMDWGGEAKPQDKADAYIGGIPTALFCWDEAQQYTWMAPSITDAHLYNLMSEEDFKRKHPGKLKFKEWDVTIGDKSVEIGGEKFSKKAIKRWYKACEEIIAHTSLVEAHLFIKENKERLGI